MVQVLHKMTPATGDEPRTLAVGQTFTFNSGDAYTVKPDGSVRRANPDGYVSKADRKARKKFHRLQRERLAAETKAEFDGLVNTMCRERATAPIALAAGVS